MDKIAIIIEDIRIGGPQKQLIYFLQQTIKKKTNNKYLIIVPKNSKNKLSKFLNLKEIEIKELNIQYLSIYSGKLYKIFRDFNELKNCLKHIEKIYSWWVFKFKSLLISTFLKKKIYFHIHDIKSNFFIRFALLILSKYIKNIFCVKMFKRLLFFFKCKPKKIILRSSVNTNYFKSTKKRNRIFKVGIIANINPDKNLELLIKIIEKINDKNIKFELIGNLFSSQKKYYNRSLSKFNLLKNRLKWKKDVLHPQKNMKTFDILISTSNSESLPLSIIEALSM